MIQSVADLLDPQCKDASFLGAEQTIFSVSPMLTVVQPWRGRHHVYSIFAIPDTHSVSGPMLLSVAGIGQFRRDVRLVMASHYYLLPFEIPPGYYAVRTYLRTRLAVFLLGQGLYWKLQNSNNWILSYGIGRLVESDFAEKRGEEERGQKKKLLIA